MGRQIQGLSGEEPTFAPPRIPPENSKDATDHSELAAGTLIQSLKRRQAPCVAGAGPASRAQRTLISLLRAAFLLAPLSLFSLASPPSRRIVTSGGRSASLVSSLPAGTGVAGVGRGRRFCGSPPPLLSSLPPFPSLDGGRSSVADSLTRP